MKRIHDHGPRPGEIPLKMFAVRLAVARGISPDSAYVHLRRHNYLGRALRRVNARVIYVLDRGAHAPPRASEGAPPEKSIIP